MGGGETIRRVGGGSVSGLLTIQPEPRLSLPTTRLWTQVPADELSRQILLTPVSLLTYASALTSTMHTLRYRTPYPCIYSAIMENRRKPSFHRTPLGGR